MLVLKTTEAVLAKVFYFKAMGGEKETLGGKRLTFDLENIHFLL